MELGFLRRRKSYEVVDMRLVGVVFFMVALTTMVGSATGEKLVKVGPRGWVPDYNYTLWSSQQDIYVGDWLLFNFDKRYYNVLEVNKTSYDNCNDAGFIKNVTRGGRDVVQLTETRPYYFLSSGGYCWHGMKLAITVRDVPPTPAPQPARGGAATALSSSGSWAVLGIAIVLSAFLVLFI